VLEQYETLLEEGDQAYQKIVDNAGKLTTVLNQQSEDTRSRYFP
jgi:hypothetical protein